MEVGVRLFFQRYKVALSLMGQRFVAHQLGKVFQTVHTQQKIHHKSSFLRRFGIKFVFISRSFYH